MITLSESIPKKTDSWLKSIDIFYVQFNDVSFYIEDTNQENFYFSILKKLFPEIRIGKIFPLNGKLNVIEKSQRSLSNPKKVFIVDKDFDNLLGRKLYQINLFYLEKYSIENYLIDDYSLKQIIQEEKPRLKTTSINKAFKIGKLNDEAINLFCEIAFCYLLIQYKELPIQNASLPPDRFVKFGNRIILNSAEVLNYKNAIQIELKKIDRRFTINSQLKKLKKKLFLKNCNHFSENIPGKYLIKYYKNAIENLFNTSSLNTDAFIYRLAIHNNFNNLNFLKQAINNYINQLN